MLNVFHPIKKNAFLFFCLTNFKKSLNSTYNKISTYSRNLSVVLIDWIIQNLFFIKHVMSKSNQNFFFIGVKAHVNLAKSGHSPDTASRIYSLS